MWCVVKRGKYLKVQDQSLFEELHKQYVLDNDPNPPEMLAGGFATFDKADEKKQEIAVARAKEERETRARMKEVGQERGEGVEHGRDGQHGPDGRESDTEKPEKVMDVVIPEIREKVQPLLGQEFAADDFVFLLHENYFQFRLANRSF